ncbi:Sodium/hydrogen exchanger family-domain-containing protein [Syncephalastrum racemosum]|uniref:Sodium/hydrogen exchanger family-domain-containing protein n=1 Tax=Syncephalastrum racemosum TaxID=13706 RepID=A0A1X2HUA9_SYNRA|nr:Sodium/hydrogen exchanger family-domain-containing protein [Syncephalastrum racemosum]
MAVETYSIVCAILGGFILLYGTTSLIIKEKLYLSEASVAIICGIIFGSIGANLINVDTWSENKDDLTREFTRTAIALQACSVMAVGIALPKAYLRKEIVSLFYLLIPGMIWMWIISGLCVWAMIPGLTFLESLMIASCFTPTDPVLANSIVQGKFAEKHVPENVRHLIAAESGANDGLGYPFLFLAIYLMQMPTGQAIGKWFYWVIAFEILLSIVIGFVVGYVARKLIQFAERRRWIDKESFLVYSIALALFLMGCVGLMGSDDLLACFIAGNSFTWDDWFRVETENSHLMEPWSTFGDVSVWRLVVLAILVLLLRRLPMVIALFKFIPSIHGWREAIFTGWFGPIGVGAIFYYTVAIENIDPDSRARQVIEPIVYFMMLSSVVVHGITIPLFYIGHYATRTLSVASTSTGNIARLHKPPLEKENQAAVGTDEAQQAGNGEVDIGDVGPPRQTTITIVTPEISTSAASKNSSPASPENDQQQQRHFYDLDDNNDHDNSSIYLPMSTSPRETTH